ncbi:uncharacterized protein LOC129589195 [Paramacrobiotus metropolitanus]|uniref:uncharacterized protein LOC129589195 n=1 Tax=Paramacrobiotus metropolitanus TaxID=2943436 RepID=UPI00244648AB|nr:uncharacterized protein LOC129589195 [Paramacrobiotus metropolitanus]
MILFLSFNDVIKQHKCSTIEMTSHVLKSQAWWALLIIIISPYQNVVILAVHDHVVPIRIVEIFVGDNPLYGYSTTKPAYDVAFREVLPTYPRVSQNLTTVVKYRPGNFTCGEAAGEMVVLMSEMWNMTVDRQTSGPVILLAPGCSTEVIPVGDFAREFQFPVLASSASMDIFSDKRRFPTVMALGAAAVAAVSQSLQLLLEQRNWTTLSILCHRDSDDPLLPERCLFISRFLAKYQSTINPLIINIVSSTSTEISDALAQAKSYSSVILILALLDYWKLFMVTHHRVTEKIMIILVMMGCVLIY